MGRVHEIKIFNTLIKTPDNKRVIIPNSLLSNGCITNIFAEPTRRVDLTYGISYQDAIGKAKEILGELIKKDSRILDAPEPEIYVAAHAESSVNLLVRVWVNSGDYWQVYFAMQEQVKLAFAPGKHHHPLPAAGCASVYRGFRRLNGLPKYRLGASGQRPCRLLSPAGSMFSPVHSPDQ